MNTKDFFTFNKSERNGIFVLSSLIFVAMLFYIFIPLFIPKKTYDAVQFDKEVSALLKERKANTKKTASYPQKESFDVFDINTSVAEQKLNPFPFDPNTMTVELWQELGLRDKQIKTIMNYRAKGGTYYKKEDFKKMYCISDEEYVILEPFIEIKISKPTYEKYTPKKEETKPLLVDINTASAEELMEIKGIGPYFSDRIIKYRLQLGGYYKIEQVMEIPKMDSIKFSAIRSFLEVNPSAIHKININTATFDALKEHPYIGYNIALALVNYRNKHGNFKQVSDIKASAMITEKIFEKIAHYLSVN